MTIDNQAQVIKAQRAALRELVRLKQIKDSGGTYTQQEKDAAWSEAQRVLSVTVFERCTVTTDKNVGWYYGAS